MENRCSTHPLFCHEEKDMTSDSSLPKASCPRAILVTGGSSGLGLATCHALADAGNTAIGIVDINAEATEAALAQLRAKGIPCAAAIGDITTLSLIHLRRRRRRG